MKFQKAGKYEYCCEIYKEKTSQKRVLRNGQLSENEVEYVTRNMQYYVKEKVDEKLKFDIVM